MPGCSTEGEMMQNTITMRRNKKIALVAHDNKKEELFEWAKLTGLRSAGRRA
jgi:hypothetical protein